MFSNVHLCVFDSAKPSREKSQLVKSKSEIREGKRTDRVKHPLDGARQTGRSSLHQELEAVVADQRDVVGR